MDKPKLWSKELIILTSVAFFISLLFYMLMTTLTYYAVESFKVSQSRAGLTTSLFTLGLVLSRVPAGKYIEAVGRKRMVCISLFLSLLASILYFVSSSMPLLLAVRFLHGAVLGTAMTSTATVVMEIIPKERRGEGTSYYMLGAVIGTALGPFIGLYISRHANFDWVFVVCTFFSLFSFVVTLFMDIPEITLTEEDRRKLRSFSFRDLFEIKAIPMASIIFIIGLAFSGILSYLESYAIETNLVSAASFFFIVFAAVAAASRSLTGRMMDSRGDNFVMYPSLALFAMSLLLLSYVGGHGSVLLLAGACAGFGYGTLWPCVQVIVVKVSPRNRIGLATSTFYFGMDAGMVVGPLLAGSVIPLTGLSGMYMVLASIVFASLFLYYFVHGRHQRSISSLTITNE